MKTVISIPNDVFAAADKLAERLAMSRSRLYATALAEYVAKHEAARVTERLDAASGAQPGGLEAGVHRAQGRAARRLEW
jgi:predicted transcriptional regulator